MMIDCERCAVRGAACAGCVMTFLTIEVRDASEVRDTHGFRDAPAERPASAVELDEAERAALAVLASSGLVPPLRLVPRERAG